jgi:hypothetical protein
MANKEGVSGNNALAVPYLSWHCFRCHYFLSTNAPMKATRSKMENVSKEEPSAELGLLFDDELRNIYWVEKALTVAIPEMIKSATTEALKLSLESHLEDAKEKVEQILIMLGEEPEEKGDEEMKVIISEAKELFKDGSWCYERVTPSTGWRKRLNTRRIYSTRRFT